MATSHHLCDGKVNCVKETHSELISFPLLALCSLDNLNVVVLFMCANRIYAENISACACVSENSER